jgi:DNA-binding GntR family transcriptional regulator
VTEPVGRPAYQQVGDDLKRRITEGEFPVGSAIPSTAKLTKTYGVSSTVIRAAVTQLRTDGLLVGRPGKGVYVRSTPEAAAQRAATIDDLSQQVEQLRAELHQAESARRDEAAAGLGALRQSVALIRSRLVDLYAQLGKPYPDDGLVPLPGAESLGHGQVRD